MTKTKHYIEIEKLNYPKIKEIIDWIFESQINFSTINITKFSDSLMLSFYIKGDGDYMKYKMRWM